MNRTMTRGPPPIMSATPAHCIHQAHHSSHPVSLTLSRRFGRYANSLSGRLRTRYLHLILSIGSQILLDSGTPSGTTCRYTLQRASAR
jgi:hypothetical protein